MQTVNLFSWRFFVFYYDVLDKIRHIASYSFSQDKSGNCLPGTTIDQEVCHPTQFEYYQYGHSGIQVFNLVIVFQWEFFNFER